MKKTIRVGFDIGGVLSKYPDVFRPLVRTLLGAECREWGVEVFIVSDMKPHEKAVKFCHDNDFWIPANRVLVADYETYGERCKEVVCGEHKIDVLIDDHMGYLMPPLEPDAPEPWTNPELPVEDYDGPEGYPKLRLFVMPNPDIPYYADGFKTDGSEGNFGRRGRTNPPGSKRPPEDRQVGDPK